MEIPVKKYLTISALLCAGVMAAQGPVYKLIYSPPRATYIGFNTLREVQPGLFYALTIQPASTIFSVTSAGTFKSIYTFPTANNNQVLTMAQGTNGRLYGAGFDATENYYYSISTNGMGLQQ